MERVDRDRGGGETPPRTPPGDARGETRASDGAGASARRSRAALRWLALLYLVVLTIVLLIPLGTTSPAARGEGWLSLRRRMSPAGVAGDVVVNVLLFVPVGFWLQRELPAPRGAAARMAAVLAAGALFSLAIETLQFLLPWRVSSAIDVATNTAGAALGAALVLLHDGR